MSIISRLLAASEFTAFLRYFKSIIERNPAAYAVLVTPH